MLYVVIYRFQLPTTIIDFHPLAVLSSESERPQKMDRKVCTRLALFGAPCSLLLLALHGTALAVTAAVPELDPGIASGGLILAVGAALLLIERFRHR